MTSIWWIRRDLRLGDNRALEVIFPAGEAEALLRLRAFMQLSDVPVFDYTNTRNRPDI